MTFELPKLDYAKNALAPIMSEETLDLHLTHETLDPHHSETGNSLSSSL